MSKREFELDLTSVCVGSGVVQLPLKMQSLFVAGGLTATVDGEELTLTFMEPRRLSGFKEHFERRGLRSNDRMRFEIEVVSEKAVVVVVASIKRERSKPVQQRAGAEHVAHTVGTQDSGAQLGGVGQPVSNGARPSWGNSDGSSQVRAVRKVRVEGGAPLPISPATQQFRPHGRDDLAQRPEAQAVARNTNGHGGWAPLDGLSPEGDQRPIGLVDFPESTVREVRRSRRQEPIGHDDPNQDRDVTWGGEQGDHAVPPLYSHGFEVVEPRTSTGSRPQPAAMPLEQPREEPQVRTVGGSVDIEAEAAELAVGVPVRRGSESQAYGAAGNQAVGEGTAALSRQNFFAPPRIPVPRNTAAGSTWQPTPATGLDVPASPVEAHQPRLIEETDVNPVRASATTNVRQAEPAPKVSVSPRLVPAPQTSELEAIDDAEFGGEYLPSGRTLENARLEGLRVDAGRDVPAAPVRLEDDLRLIEAYLDRPNTPAIVRSEVIAAELGIDDQRSERALERLSENRERVSRIRKGAYMVKSAQAGQSSRL